MLTSIQASSLQKSLLFGPVSTLILKQQIHLMTIYPDGSIEFFVLIQTMYHASSH